MAAWLVYIFFVGLAAIAFSDWAQRWRQSRRMSSTREPLYPVDGGVSMRFGGTTSATPTLTVAVGGAAVWAAALNHSATLTEPQRVTVTSGPGRTWSREAEAKGMLLLMRNLTPEQKLCFEQNDYFEVKGSQTGKVYRIVYGAQGNILDAGSYERWCVAPDGDLVIGDVMLAQKIGLECDEINTLKAANKIA